MATSDRDKRDEAYAASVLAAFKPKDPNDKIAEHTIYNPETREMKVTKVGNK